MPNWCENDLVISVPYFNEKEKEQEEKAKEQLKKCIDYMTGEHEDGKEIKRIDFNKVIPYPDIFKSQDLVAREQNKKRNEAIEKGMPHEEAWNKYPSIKDGFNSGGYEWCVKEWGTKWNATDIEVEDETDTNYIIHFSTAWAPPLPVIKELGKKFPLLEFDLRYFEMGAGFNGLLRIEQGEITVEKEAEYFGNRGG